ncbi:MAG: substrate-binding domain-containing protein [Chitinispirillales bacterium]|jgi:phosphate transport system substrate-binding protein|nr:substrate-binding domain-containing protein [Chitinispirillales bacterium]
MNKILLFGVASVLSLSFVVNAQGRKSRNTEITVISREESSGTRGAFDELMKISDGKTNVLFKEAVIVSSTDEVASKVEVDRRAIGYTSLGSVTSKVKALSVDGVAATGENVKNGTYKISRPFVVAVEKNVSNPLTRDFIKYIMSKEGQEIAAKGGYVTSDNNASYMANGLSGKLTLSGSTSVERVIERLKEGYIKLNPNVKIEINYNGSSAGIKDCLGGKSNMAMSSRELKVDEKDKLDGHTFALDAIAVIVNKDNALNGITSEMVTKIFKGEIRGWNDVK